MAKLNQVNVLNQGFAAKSAQQIFHEPDSDCKIVKYTGTDTVITPNYEFDHIIYEYRAPINNGASITFNFPSKVLDRTLHYFIFDNSNNVVSKNVTFVSSYIFLDGNTNTYIVGAGKKLVFYGTITDNKFFLRVSSESTN